MKKSLVYPLLISSALIILTPNNAYDWRGFTSRTTETKQDSNYQPKKREPVTRERVKSYLKRIIKYGSPEQGRIINPVIEGVDTGIKRGNHPGTGGTTWNQKRRRIQK